jgi:hypothetical protein
VPHVADSELAYAIKKAVAPDEAGSSLWARCCANAWFSGASSKDSAPRKAAPAGNVTFTIWIDHRIYMHSIFFGAKDLYLFYRTRSSVRKKRSAERKNKN